MTEPQAHPTERFEVDPWEVREVHLDLKRMSQSESMFALSNGHIGVRANLDEGEPVGIPGTYLNGFRQVRDLPYAESGFGYPETGESVVNVTNGKLIRLLVDDEPFDIRYGRLHKHVRTLDMRSGMLHREAVWESPSHQMIRVRSSRLVSVTQRAVLAIRYQVEALESPARVVIQSELVANEPVRSAGADPRAGGRPIEPLDPVEHYGDHWRGRLLHRARSSRLLLAASMSHWVPNPNTTSNTTTAHDDWVRLITGDLLRPGETFEIVKFVAYGWSRVRTEPALRDQVDAAAAAATITGWDQLVKEQEAGFAEFWDQADVQIDGDPALQQAVRFGLFHCFQTSTRAERRAIPAKGLTGPGYDGHAFWDTEGFVLPLLTATHPKASADALRWRHATLPLAIDRAKALHLEGATFPWRTIGGAECSGYWPASTSAMHVNADIAMAAARHVWWTGDEEFDQETALPLLVQTARLFASLGYWGRDKKFHIDGVTGPDEYSALQRDNIFTNLMAGQNLIEAAAVAKRWPDLVAELDVTDDEIERWQAAGRAVAMPLDEGLGLHQQSLGYTTRELWDFNSSEEAHQYPLLLNAHYFDIYRMQVVKQADLVLAMHWCGDCFTEEQKCRGFRYYEAITVRDSSLSACTQAVVAAATGHLGLAYDYASEAAFMDLHDLEDNTRDGVHMASLAGAWMAMVAGFGGMRDYGGKLSFWPQLPPTLQRLGFRLTWRGACLEVAIGSKHVEYCVRGRSEEGITFDHCGESVTLADGETARRKVRRRRRLTSRPIQPAGRAPADRAEIEPTPDPANGDVAEGPKKRTAPAPNISSDDSNVQLEDE